MADEMILSIAMQFFKDLDGKADCNYCDRKLMPKSDGENLIRHMKNQHPAEYKRDYQPPIPFSKKKTVQLDETLLRLFTKNYLAFQLVESPEFEDFIKQLNPAYTLPSRKTLSKVLLSNSYLKMREKVQAELRKAKFVSLTINGWKAKSDDNYLAVTVHFLDKKAALKTYFLDCFHYPDRPTSEYLPKELRRITEKRGIYHKIRVVTCCSTDIVAAIKPYNFYSWEMLLCFAYQLNNIVKRSLQEITDTISKVRNIAKLFKSTGAAQRLTRMQQKLGEPELHVKLDVSTIWYSTIDMFERILKIKKSLLSIMAAEYTEMESLNEEDFKVMESSNSILSAFREATEEMSSDKNFWISEVILLANGLKTKCENFLSEAGHPDNTTKMVLLLKESISSVFPYETIPHYAQSTLLDPRFKSFGFTNEDAFKKASSDLIDLVAKIENPASSILPSSVQECPIPAKKKRDIWEDFDNKVESILNNTDPLTEAKIEVENYLKESLQRRSQDPGKWWYFKKEAYPRLYKIFTKRFCVSPTAVPPALVFTKDGQLIVERRKLLRGNKVSKILFLSHNS